MLNMEEGIALGEEHFEVIVSKVTGFTSHSGGQSWLIAEGCS